MGQPYQEPELMQPDGRDFDDWYQQSLAPHLRPVLIISIIFSLAAIGVHVLLYPDRVWHGTALIVGGFITLPLLVVFLLSFRSIHPRGVKNIATLLGLVAALGVNAVVGWGYYNNFNMPYEGTLIVTVAIGMFSSLPLLRVALISLISCASFTLIVIKWSPEPLDVGLMKAFFLMFFSLIACLIANMVQRFFRSEYRRQRALLELSETDPLTELLNRRGFEIRFDLASRSALRNEKMLGLILLDLDFFKAYNDTYGHEAGDHALQMLGRLLRDFARRPFDAAARLGGEEFCLLLHDVDNTVLQEIGDSLCQAVANLKIPHRRSKVASVITISAGITAVSPGTSLQLAYRTADRALYDAKEQGRNRWVWRAGRTLVPATED